VALLLVTGLTQGLKIADVIHATSGDRDDVIDLQLCLGSHFTAATALVVVSLQDVFSNFWWDNSPFFANHSM
jgi:hypothetical protein